MNGAGNSTSELYYECMDEHPSTGISYYRLSQTDYDGKTEFFEPVIVRMQGDTPESLRIKSIYPNPFEEELSFVFSEKPPTGKVCLVNSAGQVVRMEKMETGENKFKLNHLDNLLPGTYYLCFVSKDNKVVLQK